MDNTSELNSVLSFFDQLSDINIPDTFILDPTRSGPFKRSTKKVSQVAGGISTTPRGV